MWIKPAAAFVIAAAFLPRNPVNLRHTSRAVATRKLPANGEKLFHGKVLHVQSVMGHGLVEDVPRINTAKNTATTTKPKRTHSDFKSPVPASIVSNKGQTANFMLYWPSITTFTLVQGWTARHTEQLKRAVKTVVQRNPILTGRAQSSGLLGKTKVSIKLGAFPIESHDYISEFYYDAIERVLPAHGNLRSLGQTELIRFMDEHLAPLLPRAESVMESVKSGNPLFGVDLITLPDEYACYAMRLSHCVGDGVTYYKIMNEINHYFNYPVVDDENANNNAVKTKDPPTALDWTAPDIATHEIWPSRYSKADVQKAYGFPFLLGLLRNICKIGEQTKDYIVLSKAKIEVKKKEMVDKLQHGHLSSNDVITAALCQANKSSDLFCFTMNMRHLPSCRHYGLNFHNEVPFPRRMVSGDPNAFRSMLKQGYYYETDQLPTWPFVAGRVGRLSSLASIQHLIQSSSKDNEVKVLCHGLLSSTAENVPLDAAFVTSMNDENFLVTHNFRRIDQNANLLQEIRFE